MMLALTGVDVRVWATLPHSASPRSGAIEGKTPPSRLSPLSHSLPADVTTSIAAYFQRKGGWVWVIQAMECEDWALCALQSGARLQGQYRIIRTVHDCFAHEHGLRGW